jgi:NAD(P)-dependent dehydrogenase (short-subunit alcohol dehydrogenase family)
MSGVLAGRTALVTGASQGLGYAIAESYVREGCSVFLCARGAETLAAAADRLAGRAPAGVRVAARAADVAAAGDVKDLVGEAQRVLGGLDILVNNAGVYGPFGRIEDIDWDAWVDAVNINLMGSVLLCRHVVPVMRTRRYGKIIQLSGGGATNPLPGISAYAVSKAAVVRFAETLAEELREDRIDVNAIAPGALNTRLLDEVIAAGPDRVGAGFYGKALKQRDEGGTPLTRGAELAVYLASKASDGITGKLISAVWDPWEDFQAHAGELNKSDIYTLRRIVPKDRAMTWGDRSPR